MSYRIMSYHTTSYHITSHHIISYHIITHHIIWYDIIDATALCVAYLSMHGCSRDNPSLTHRTRSLTITNRTYSTCSAYSTAHWNINVSVLYNVLKIEGLLIILNTCVSSMMPLHLWCRSIFTFTASPAKILSPVALPTCKIRKDKTYFTTYECDKIIWRGEVQEEEEEEEGREDWQEEEEEEGQEEKERRKRDRKRKGRKVEWS